MISRTIEVSQIMTIVKKIILILCPFDNPACITKPHNATTPRRPLLVTSLTFKPPGDPLLRRCGCHPLLAAACPAIAANYYSSTFKLSGALWEKAGPECLTRNWDRQDIRGRQSWRAAGVATEGYTVGDSQSTFGICASLTH